MWVFSRRGFLLAGPLALAGMALAPRLQFPTVASEPGLTPAQTEGPFYPDSLPEDRDNDLLRIAGEEEHAKGEPLELAGTLSDPEGHPFADCLLEIWQADAAGRYHHSEDRAEGTRDPAFQGYGTTRTDSEGRYSFRTIRPVPYGSRTPHIHFKVHHPDGQVLTTQMYVADEQLNDSDWLYNRLSPEEQALVTVPLERLEKDEEATWTGHFPIVLPRQA
ncbi:MAG: intradiol ring-cleavage dioxygenase [Pseudomonadota bacterium]